MLYISSFSRWESRLNRCMWNECLTSLQWSLHPSARKPFLNVAFITSFPVFKLQRSHFTQSPHLSFMVLCNLLQLWFSSLTTCSTASLGLPPTALDVQLLTDSWKEVQAKSRCFLTCLATDLSCASAWSLLASRELVHKLPTLWVVQPTRWVSHTAPLSCARGTSTSRLVFTLLLCRNISCALGYGYAYVLSCSQVWQMLWDLPQNILNSQQSSYSVMYIECYELELNFKAKIPMLKS